MAIGYEIERIGAREFADVLRRSGLAERRPADDPARLQRMLDHANLIVTARRAADGRLVGIARSLTDWSYATYLCDLAVDQAHAGEGIGRRLIAQTRKAAGEECALVLVAAPGATGFYERIAMPRCETAFAYRRER